MKLILSTVFSILCLLAAAQQPDWSATKNWKIYLGEGPQVFSYPIDTLQFIPAKMLDQDTLQHFLTKAKILPRERTPTWMGSYLASYETSKGEIKKVEISIYGGFFYDQSTSTYYQVPRELINPWLIYVVGNMNAIKTSK